ncbi:phosphotransferase family protein [Nocardia sp. NPDC059177]|uniref:phosphotransferase family protein n=1 Tax=Nocardia sp. NPDC059177 TaxID=3346759 RepID=UPI0036AAA582
MIDETIAPERLADCLAVVEAGLGLDSAAVRGIAPQTGGLFNYLLRVDTTQGTYFFKQYLDDVPNPLYSPPRIPAAERAELAGRVQMLAAACSTQEVPEIVAFDRRRCAFLMTAASGDEPLNAYLARGEQPRAVLTELPRALAGLHQSTHHRFPPDSLFANTAFRDFKLRLQYDDITAHLTPPETERVLACRRAYQARTDCVTHGDLNSRNILATDTALGIIDFEQSHLGTPAYDLAYLLCELLISMETAGAGDRVARTIAEFLDHYCAYFTAASRDSVETEMTQHLAVQTLYRFWGPSRAAWTSYVDEACRERIIARARALLMATGPVTAVLADLRN